MTNRAKATVWTITEQVISGVVVLLICGGLCLWVTKEVVAAKMQEHTEKLLGQDEHLGRLDETVGTVKTDVAVTRAVVERIERKLESLEKRP